MRDRDWNEDLILVTAFFAAFAFFGLVLAVALHETAVLAGAVVSSLVVLPVVWFLTREREPL